MACSGCLSLRDLYVSSVRVECFVPPTVSIRALALSNGLPLCQSAPALAVRGSSMPRLAVRNVACVPLQADTFFDYRLGDIVFGGDTAILGGD